MDFAEHIEKIVSTHEEMEELKHHIAKDHAMNRSSLDNRNKFVNLGQSLYELLGELTKAHRNQK